MKQQNRKVWHSPSWRQPSPLIFDPVHAANLSKQGLYEAFALLWRRLSAGGYPRGGLINNGNPVTTKSIADELNLSLRRVQKIMSDLRAMGYLASAPCGPRGARMAVRIWTTAEGPNDGWAEGLSGLDLDADEPNQEGCRKATGRPETAAIADAKSGQVPGDHRREGAPNVRPPSCISPYKEIGKREYKESTTTTVVPFERGRGQLRSVGQNQGNRQASPASQELDYQLSLIPDNERPIRTKTLERAFLDYSPHLINQIFDRVHGYRKTSGNLINPPGWWARMLADTAWGTRKKPDK